jgi:hypothetical protein
MSKSPPREPLFLIEVAKECFEVAEGDVDRAMTMFRQTFPNLDDEEMMEVTREYLSRLASKKVGLTVQYYSYLNLGQPELRAALRARVAEILQSLTPEILKSLTPSRGAVSLEHRTGKIMLAGVTHTFRLSLTEYVLAAKVDLFVLLGSIDDDDEILDAIDNVLDARLASKPGEVLRGYVDQVDQVWL